MSCCSPALDSLLPLVPTTISLYIILLLTLVDSFPRLICLLYVRSVKRDFPHTYNTLPFGVQFRLNCACVACCATMTVAADPIPSHPVSNCASFRYSLVSCAYTSNAPGEGGRTKPSSSKTTLYPGNAGTRNPRLDHGP